MSIRQLLSFLVLLAISVSCSRDPNVIKARYLQNGNKYFDKGKYKEASIMYRTALQKDQKFGEAYYRMALTQLKMEQPFAAIQSLRRAVELLKPQQPERMDARVKLADVYLDYLERLSKREAEIVDEIALTASDLVKADPKSLDGHRLKGRLSFIAAQEAASKKEATKMKERLQEAIASCSLSFIFVASFLEAASWAAIKDKRPFKRWPSSDLGSALTRSLAVSAISSTISASRFDNRSR